MNPTISKLAIATAFLKDAVSARTEYDAEFRSDLESFISREALLACVHVGMYERQPIQRTSDYRAFVDMGGGRRDSSVLCIAHDENGIAVLDLLHEVKAPFSPEEVVQGFCATLKRWKVSEVTGDAYSADWNTDSWTRNGVTYRTSDLSRSQLYLNALPIITSRQCRLLHSERMVAQFCALERKTGRNQDSIDHPPNGWDDVCNAVAGAVYLTAGRSNEYPVLDMQTSGRWERLRATLANTGAAAAVVVKNVFGAGIPMPPMNPPSKQTYELNKRRLGLDKVPLNPVTAAAFNLPDTPPCIDVDCRKLGKCTIWIPAGMVRCQNCARQWSPKLLPARGLS